VRLSFIHIISGPLIGGIIGFITNCVAIKMLFRPLKPLYIGRFKLPFTPGVVPRRKDELAHILGNAVVAEFFNADDLARVFTSDSLRDAFAESIVDLLCDEKLAPRDLLDAPAEELERVLRAVKEELCVRILAGVLKSDPASVLARAGAELSRRRFRGGPAEKLGEEILASVAETLSRDIEAYILSDGRDLLMPLLDAELDELSREPVGARVNALFPDRAALTASVGALYERFMRAYVRPIVSSIDVGGMVAAKLRGMDAAEIESLTLAVVRKEFRYLVWLGALLGIVIGAVNIFI
jgi:uncharacterized membrane protein YheB (UPF0754 family)